MTFPRDLLRRLLHPGFEPRRPVFVLGCARSGTSILGEAFEAHPRVTYLFEYLPRVVAEAVPEREDDRLTREDATPAAARAVRRALWERMLREGAKARGTRLVEKDPRSVFRVPFLDAVYPDAVFVHIVRDGLDNVCSLRVKNSGPEWEHAKPPAWRQALSWNPIRRNAWLWRTSVETAQADLAGVPQARRIDVRYEEYVARPVETARAALACAGLDLTPEVERFCRQSVADSVTHPYHARHQAVHTKTESRTRRVGRWREELTPADVHEFLVEAGDLQRRLGYACG